MKLFDQWINLHLGEEHRILLEIFEARNRELTQQLAEMQSLRAAIVAGNRANSAAMSIPCQEKSTSAYATLTISSNTILYSVIPPAGDKEVYPMSLDTITLGIADTLPNYHADVNG